MTWQKAVWASHWSVSHSLILPCFRKENRMNADSRKEICNIACGLHQAYSSKSKQLNAFYVAILHWFLEGLSCSGRTCKGSAFNFVLWKMRSGLSFLSWCQEVFRKFLGQLMNSEFSFTLRSISFFRWPWTHYVPHTGLKLMEKTIFLPSPLKLHEFETWPLLCALQFPKRSQSHCS